MKKFLCTRVDCPTKMFTPGKTYQGFTRLDPMPGNIAYHVFDDLGHERVLLDEPNSRFIINNPCSIYNGRTIPDYAYFEVVK